MAQRNVFQIDVRAAAKHPHQRTSQFSYPSVICLGAQIVALDSLGCTEPHSLPRRLAS